MPAFWTHLYRLICRYRLPGCVPTARLFLPVYYNSPDAQHIVVVAFDSRNTSRRAATVRFAQLDWVNLTYKFLDTCCQFTVQDIPLPVEHWPLRV